MAEKMTKSEKQTIEEGLFLIKFMFITCLFLTVIICLLSLIPSISAFEFGGMH